MANDQPVDRIELSPEERNLFWELYHEEMMLVSSLEKVRLSRVNAMLKVAMRIGRPEVEEWVIDPKEGVCFPKSKEDPPAP